jgi:hypothetical protein
VCYQLPLFYSYIGRVSSEYEKLFRGFSMEERLGNTGLVVKPRENTAY